MPAGVFLIVPILSIAALMLLIMRFCRVPPKPAVMLVSESAAEKPITSDMSRAMVNREKTGYSFALTIINGEVVHVLDGWERNRYYLCENGRNKASGSALAFSYNYYAYSGTELNLVESVIHKSLQDEKNAWFYSTGNEPDIKNAEPIRQEKAAEIMNKYVHEHPQYTPLVE